MSVYFFLEKNLHTTYYPVNPLFILFFKGKKKSLIMEYLLYIKYMPKLLRFQVYKPTILGSAAEIFFFDFTLNFVIKFQHMHVLGSYAICQFLSGS